MQATTILVISDTHRRLGAAQWLLETKRPDYCIHLGDMLADCQALERQFPMQKLLYVLGNNDSLLRGQGCPLEFTATIAGKRLFLCHGHTLYVKAGLSRLTARAKEEHADMVLYGHTHLPCLQNDSGLLILNPGTVGTYGWVVITGEKIHASIERVKEHGI